MTMEKKHPRGSHTRAVIVHPRFAHTLADPPVPSVALTADWRHLPYELLEAVASHLDKAQDLLALSAVCRDTTRLAACPKLWREQCRRRFGVPVPEDVGLKEDPAAARPTFWRDLYQYNHRVFNDLLRSGRPDSARFDTLRFAQGPVVIQMQ